MKRHRQLTYIAALLALAPVFGRQLLAQGCTGTPSQCGQWDPVRSLTLGDHDADIAQAALMPLNGGQIMFWCRQRHAGQNPITYRWRSGSPTTVTPFVVPPPAGGAVPGDIGLKCSVALFTEDGKLRTYGGDVPNKWFVTPGSEQTFYGVPYIYEFDPFGSPAGWVQVMDSTGQYPEEMNNPRWYCTGTVLHDNRVFILGDAQLPHAVTQGGSPSSDSYDLFQNGQWYTSSVLSNLQHRPWDTSPCFATVAPDHLLTGQYARIRHLASNGKVMWIDGWFDNLFPGLSGDNKKGQLVAYMDLDVQTSLCPQTDLLPQFRWEIRRPTLPTGTKKWAYGQVAHIVTYDNDGTNIGDHVYRVSGGDRASCAVNIEANTLRLSTARELQGYGHVPGDNLDWEVVNATASQTPTSMNVPRIFGNVVVLSDGSLFITGGYDGMNNTVSSERFEPIELFPNSAQTWQPLPDQGRERYEHSVGLLLPDGSVWVAGGQKVCVYNSNTPQDSWHSFQVYRPPYQFQGGLRPEIADVGGPWTTSGGGLANSIVVEYGTGIWPQPEIERVALIRNGSSTHHDDQNQRYINVPVTSQFPGPGSTRIVQVALPPNDQVAPHGYYMLVVIDVDGRPSPGRFVQLQ